MRTILLILVLCGCTFATSQKSTNLPTDFKNVKTKKHIRLPGTRFFIELPATYKISPYEIGYIRKADTSFVQFQEKPGTHYLESYEGLLRSFQGTGAEVLDSATIRFGTYSGKLLHIKGITYTRLYFLVFGDTNLTCGISGAYAVDDTLAHQAIRRTLLSCQFDHTFEYDPFEVANFTIDESKSTYKFSKYTYGTFMYTVNGVKRIFESDDPFIYINMPHQDTSWTARNYADLNIKSLQGLGLQVYNLNYNTTLLKMNGYEVCELKVSGYKNTKKHLVYIFTMTNRLKTTCLVGYIAGDFENHLLEMQKLAYTLTLKK